jgi:hypothetical protein
MIRLKNRFISKQNFVSNTMKNQNQGTVLEFQNWISELDSELDYQN